MANLPMPSRRFEHCGCEIWSVYDVWYDMVTWIYKVNFN